MSYFGRIEFYSSFSFIIPKTYKRHPRIYDHTKGVIKVKLILLFTADLFRFHDIPQSFLRAILMRELRRYALCGE